MKLSVQMIYDRTCPNVREARSVLREVFARLGLEGAWEEYDREAPSTPMRLRGYGSPTILVDGNDVAAMSEPSAGDCCRLYDDGGGRLSGVPPVELVMRAVAAGAERRADDPEARG